MVDFSNRDARVCVIGRTEFTTGIGAFSHAATELFSRHVPTCILPTDHDEPSTSHIELPSGRQIPVCDDLGSQEIFFFSDILFNGASDYNLSRMPEHGLHLAHLCFDSDQLPPEWIWRLNHHFDGAYVPSVSQQDLLLEVGVRIPIGVLPIALPLEGLLARQLRMPSEKLTFGTITAFHERKDLERLVSAFQEEFRGRDDVELIIHSNLTIGPVYDRLRAATRGSRAPRVKLSRRPLSHSERDDLIESFDIFVNCSRGEGYSIGAREALALGKALVLSDIGAHQDLLGTTGTFRVAADLPTVARYPEIDNRVFGLQQRVRVEALRAGLAEAAAFATSDAFEASAVSRRRRAAEFSFSDLSLEYAAIVDPDAPTTRLGRAARRSEISWHCPESVEAVRSLGPVRRWAAPRSRVVVPCHDAGFFSVFNTYISHLVWALQDDRCHSVLPDWDQSRLSRRIGSDARESFCYGTLRDGNIWTALFEPVFGMTSEDMDDEAELYRGASLAPNLYNEALEPTLTYTNAYELYGGAEFVRFRRQYHEAYQRFVTPRPELLAPVEALLREQVGDRLLLSAHVKHPSHVIEQPDGVLASNAAYFERVRSALDDRDVDVGSDRWRLFLGTDQDSVVEAFHEKFPGKVVTFDGVRRTTIAEDEEFAAIGPDAQAAPGFQVQHLVAASQASWSVTMAEEIIRDALAMASAEVLLHVVSNVATAVSFMNPRIQMEFVDAEG